MRRPKYDPVVLSGISYARDVVARRVPAGRWVKLACRRFLDDLRSAEAGEGRWAFDGARARKPSQFAALMSNIKGPEAGQPFDLMPWQYWLLANLFGFVDRETGVRRFRQASIWCPRGNGKSSLAATIVLYMTFVEDEGGAEGYAAAVTRAQARIVFDMAKTMVNRSPRFREEYGVNTTADAVYQIATASKLAPVSSDAKALDGLNVHCAIVDEIASHRSAAVYDVLITAMGKRAQPLLVSISTATDNTTGIGRQVWNYTEAVLSGTVSDDRLFGVIYAGDIDDDPWSEATWEKANPGWAKMVQPEAVRALARQALASPALQAAFKTRHLNQWVAAENPLFDMMAWSACEDPDLRIEDFHGQPCFAGLDMAARADIAAGALIFPRLDPETQKTTYAVFAKAWLPAAAVDVGRNPIYARWVEDEVLTITEGETTDFQAIEDWVRAAADIFDLRVLGYDPYLMLNMAQRLMNDGYPLKKYQATVLNFSEPVKIWDAAMRDRLIRHDGDPVLAWCMGNVVGTYDARGNVYPKRDRTEKKIDCAIAMVMAFGVLLENERENDEIYAGGKELLVF